MISALICKGQTSDYWYGSDTKELPYNIKPYQKNEEVTALYKQSELRIKDRQLGSLNPEAIRNLFKYRKDGIVLEVVLNDQLSCESEVYHSTYNRRNNNSSINGKLYFPIYKRALLKDQHFKMSKQSYLKDRAARLRKAKTARDRFKRRYTITKSKLLSSKMKKMFSSSRSRPSKEEIREKTTRLSIQKNQEQGVMKMLKSSIKAINKENWDPIYWNFALPSKQIFVEDTTVEVNILLLRKNRIAYPLYYSQLDSELSFRDSIQLTPWSFEKSQIVLKPKRKVLTTQIDFKRNETSVNSTKFELFKIKLKDYLIDTISLTAFASVEGSEAGNERLFEQRTDSLYHSLKSYHSSAIVFEHEMSENWAMFDDQIAKDLKYHTWKGLPKDTVRQMLRELANEKPWEEYLNNQRSAKVRVAIHENISDTIAYLKKHYDFKDANDQKMVLDFLINESLSHRLNPTYVKKMRFNRDSTKYSPHILSKYMFEYQTNIENEDFNLRTFSRTFFRRINIRKASTDLLNKYLQILIMHWDDCKPDVPSNYKLFDELASRGVNNRPMAIFALRALDYYQQYFDQPKAKYYYQFVDAERAVNELPSFIYNFYKEDSLFTSSRHHYLQLAQMFVKCDKTGLAYDLLQNYQDKYYYDVEFKSLQLKMSYSHSFNDNGMYVEELIRQHANMPNDEWCKLFKGEYPISFQSKDWTELRVLYCSECNQ